MEAQKVKGAKRSKKVKETYDNSTKSDRIESRKVEYSKRNTNVMSPRERYKQYTISLNNGINLRAGSSKDKTDDFGFLNEVYEDFTGIVQPKYTVEEKKTLKQYRELSYLFPSFMPVWRATAKHSRKRRSFFKKLEEDLVKIEKADLEGKLGSSSFKATVDKELLFWYNGNILSEYQDWYHNLRLMEYMYHNIMGERVKDLFIFKNA